MRPALLALVALLAACTPAATPHRFRVATDPHHTPLSFRDDANQTVGYEIDLIRAVAQNRGWELELVEASATGLIRDNRDQGMLARLEKGEFDAVISSVVRSNRLLERWSVSAPYLNAGPVAVVRQGTEPVRWDGTWEGSLGVVEYGSATSAVGKTELPRWRWRLYGDPASALLDLEGGLLDGAVVGRVERAAAVYDSEKLQVKLAPASAPLTDDENYVIVVGKNDERLAALEEALRALEDSGVAPNLRRKWFLE